MPILRIPRRGAGPWLAVRNKLLVVRTRGSHLESLRPFLPRFPRLSRARRGAWPSAPVPAAPWGECRQEDRWPTLARRPYARGLYPRGVARNAKARRGQGFLAL